MAIMTPTSIKTDSVLLQYECTNTAEHDSGGPATATQPLKEIVDNGTPLCPECDELMALQESVIIAVEV